MAKVTLGELVIEGSIEELRQMGVKIPFDEPLKVGDYAKIIQTGHANEGEIVTIICDDYYEDFPFDTKLLDGTRGDCHNASQIVRVTDDEVAEAKHELSEKKLEAKWAKIGRKPDEFKVGDAVRYKKAFTLVSGIKPDGIVAINQSNHISKNLEVRAEDLTLVFPAEAKFE